jgi:hypothetical protein
MVAWYRPASFPEFKRWGDPHPRTVKARGCGRIHRQEPGANKLLPEGFTLTLEQTCPPEYQGAQCAFKDSMIH